MFDRNKEDQEQYYNDIYNSSKVNKRDQIRKKLKKLEKRKMLQGHRIIIFGAAMNSKAVWRNLLELGYKIDEVIDNDVRKIGKESMAQIVKSPAEVLTPFDDKTAIFIYSGVFYNEIVHQLNGYGYEKDKHIHVLNNEFDDTAQSLLRVGKYLLGAIAFYKRLTFELPRDTVLFVAPYAGMGDIYLSGLFFSEYIKRNNIKKYTFVVVSKSCKKVASLFDIKNIATLPIRKVASITEIERAVRLPVNIKILNDAWGFDEKQWIRGYNELSFDKVFRYFIFGFDDEVPYELPKRKDNKKKIDKLFNRYKLTRGRTVILSPYSNTLFEMPAAFWETLANFLNSKGFTVCTNCGNKYEYAIKGTKAIVVPLTLMIDFMDQAGYFIGMRTGLCEVISTSVCKKIILYEKDGYFYKSSPLEYFSLVRMGLCEDAIELECKQESAETVIDLIQEELSNT